jgi:hypothetical protein
MDVENKIRFNLIIGAKTRVHVNSTRLSRSVELLVVWGGVFFFLVTGDINLMTITWHDPSCFLAEVPAPTRF